MQSQLLTFPINLNLQVTWELIHEAYTVFETLWSVRERVCVSTQNKPSSICKEHIMELTHLPVLIFPFCVTAYLVKATSLLLGAFILLGFFLSSFKCKSKVNSHVKASIKKTFFLHSFPFHKHSIKIFTIPMSSIPFNRLYVSYFKQQTRHKCVRVTLTLNKNNSL